MHTALAAVTVSEEFNADYYIAIVTILSIGFLAVEVVASFARLLPVEQEAKWSPVFDGLVSFFYLWTPFISAVGIVASIIALFLREENVILRGFVFLLCLAILIFMASVATAYLWAVDRERNEKARKAKEKSSTESTELPRPTG